MIRSRHGWVCMVLTAGWVLGITGAELAQESDPDFWVSGTNVDFVSAEEFNCSQVAGDCRYRIGVDGFWAGSTADAIAVYAQVELPAGALVQGYRVIYDDIHVDLNMIVVLERSWYLLSGTSGSEQISSWTFSRAPGKASIRVDVDPGITAGCGGGNFCPDTPLTRAQMAVVLAKTLGLHCGCRKWAPVAISSLVGAASDVSRT